jgi:hypothetical protein
MWSPVEINRLALKWGGGLRLPPHLDAKSLISTGDNISTWPLADSNHVTNLLISASDINLK